MLWQSIACSSIIISASRSGVTSSPRTSHEMSWVLAEDAAEVATREKDRPRAAPAAQAVLLTEVREVGGDDRVPADCAQTRDVGSTVDLAAARTDHAALTEQLVRFGRTALELGTRERDGQHVRCNAAAVFRGSSCA
jgi:hypothetical protein